jgi:hypothetical protein
MKTVAPVTAGGDAEDIPEVYLCQVSERVSCGACCGLYNIPRLSRARLEDRLARRTQRFAEIARTEEGIEQYRHEIEGWTPEDRPFARFYHCPFLGLIGATRSRVGCLLHPTAPLNDGHDWRVLSYYGAKACRRYFCPASRALPSRWAQILRGLLDDWYAYGLIITEHRLLNAIGQILENRLGRPLRALDFKPRSPAAAGLQELVVLKLAWPHRDPSSPGPCHWVLESDHDRRPQVQWPGVSRPGSPYETLFRELESVFACPHDQERAEARLDRRFNRLLDLLR